MQRLRALAPLVALAIAVAACGGGDARSSPTPGVTFEAGTPNVGLPTATLSFAGHDLRVEVADTPRSRETGLAYRDALPADAGMLFDMGQPSRPGFWMKGMRFPLDFVWIDETKTVAEVTPGVQPQPGTPDSRLPLYSPSENIRYVLEVNAGAAARLGLVPGTVVQLTLR
ncbi:MAG TPA: DUF192 domain-containing protein [Dehalococcoidia bacterium]|nr:DUF192 domain-containing protein [Dehalococcoidia bacterium]